MTTQYNVSDSACKAENHTGDDFCLGSEAPPCLEFYRVRECIFEQFLLLNDVRDQSAFDSFMDELAEEERNELMAITREAVEALIKDRQRLPVRGGYIGGTGREQRSGSGKHKPASHWRRLMEGVPAGGRDNALTSVAGMLLRNPDVPPDQRLPLLRQFNERYCQPPVSEADIRRIAGVFRRYS